VRTGRARRRPVSHVNVVVPVPEKNPFSGTGTTTISGGEEGMETAADGSQVGPIAGNGAGGHALAAIEPLEGGGAVLAELARAVEHDLATRTTPRPPSAPTPTTGPILPRSAAATASHRSRRPRRPSHST